MGGPELKRQTGGDYILAADWGDRTLAAEWGDRTLTAEWGDRTSKRRHFIPIRRIETQKVENFIFCFYLES